MTTVHALTKMGLFIKFVRIKTQYKMDIIEKRDFIHSHLHKADENTINEFYEKLHKEELLKAKLESRALRSERDIQSGKVFSRTDVERRIETLEQK